MATTALWMAYNSVLQLAFGTDEDVVQHLPPGTYIVRKRGHSVYLFQLVLPSKAEVNQWFGFVIRLPVMLAQLVPETELKCPIIPRALFLTTVTARFAPDSCKDDLAIHAETVLKSSSEYLEWTSNML